MDFFTDAPIHPSSCKTYNSKLNEWISFMPEHFQTIVCVLSFPDLAMKILQTHLKCNTNTNRHIYIVAIMSYIRHHFKELAEYLTDDHVTLLRARWIAINNDNEAPIIQRRLENKPTAIQERKGGSRISFEQIVSKRDELAPGSIERVLLCMYTMIPPVRADYFTTQLVHGETAVPTEKNYIRILTDGTMESTLTDFKTASVFGRIVNLFPPELAQEIRLSLEKHPREYLFLNARGKPHTRNSFTLWSRRVLSRIFETDFTLVFFRHAFSTHYMITHHHTITDAQIKEISDKMGHSAEMFKAYRWIQGLPSEDPVDSDEEKE